MAASSRTFAMASADRPDVCRPPSIKIGRTVRVAVVGAGSSGLAAARELSIAGHDVTVFERGTKIGGLWASTMEAEEEEEEDESGGDTGNSSSQTRRRRRVHSSVYPSLRTNLPRVLMGFTSYPFTREAMEMTAEEQKRGRRKEGNVDGDDDDKDGGELEDSTSSSSALDRHDRDDFRTYPGHASVLRYLQAYSDEFDLEKFVRYGRELVRASPVFSAASDDGDGERHSLPPPPLPWPRWRVVTRATVPASAEGDAFLSLHPSPSSSSNEEESNEEEKEEIFDALVCCSGHFAVPRFPPSALSALELKRGKSPLAFPGLIMHAHSYRGPTAGPLGEVLKKKKEGKEKEIVVVAVVGAGPSGEDIAREVSSHADKVLLCSAAWENVPFPKGEKQNIEPRPFIVGLEENGRVKFGGRDEGEEKTSAAAAAAAAAALSDSQQPPPSERVDAVIYATGYLYEFPELDGSVVVEDNEVLQAGGISGEKDEKQQPLPLFEHLFPPSLAPGLSLLGLPFKVVPFPLVEAQARLVARALALVPNNNGGEGGEGQGIASPPSPSAAFPWPATKMREAALAAARERADAGVARRHAHRMGCPSHFDYIDRLIDAAEALGGVGGGGGNGACEDGDENDSLSSSSTSFSSLSAWRLAPWRQEMYVRASEARKLDADSYRDSADLGETVEAAEVEVEAWVEERRRRRRERK